MREKGKRDSHEVSPLATFIQAKRKALGNPSWNRMAASAAPVYVTGETIRKAALDGYKEPLPPSTVTQLAAALDVSERRVRELDNLRWAPPDDNVMPALIEEVDVLRWLREHLPDHLGEHLVQQYFILREAAERGAGGRQHSPPSKGKSGPRLPTSHSKDGDRPESPARQSRA